MDEIARASGVSRSLLYVYFQDKEDILAAIMLRAANALRQRFYDVAGQTGTGRARVTALGYCYYRFSLEEPYYFDMLTHTAAFIATHEDRAQDVISTTAEIMAIMTRAIESGISDGSICANLAADSLQTALYLRGAFHGVIMLARTATHPMIRHRLAKPDALVTYTIERLTSSLMP